MEKSFSARVGEDDDDEVWVHDSSVDHRGRPPSRATTGAWKAAVFIIWIEFSERLSNAGLSSSLMIYLTKVLHQEMKVAAKNVNYWVSVTTLMPLLGGFLADGYLGRFSAVVFSTAVYLLGLAVLATAQLAPVLNPGRSPRLHEALFFAGIYLVAVGTGGHKPALESFGADQFDDTHVGERAKKMSFFNWWNCALCAGILLGVTAVVYAQERLGFGAATLVIAAVMAASLAVFLAARRTYRYRPVPAEGSPLVPPLRVLVAAVRKRRLRLPEDAAELYEVSVSPPQRVNNKRMLRHTDRLRFLDRAAIVEVEHVGGAGVSAWRLATVTEVEETKLVVAMVPIWVTTLTFGMMVAQSSTFFIKQGSVTDNRLGGFNLPPASMFALSAVAMIATVAVYDRALVPCLRRRHRRAAGAGTGTTGSERGLSILTRVGIGMAFTTAALGVAAAAERRRLLRSATAAPSSVLWLVPQFVIMGVGDAFAVPGLQEYFYEQVPDGMRSLGIGLYLSVFGAGTFLSSLVITAADRASSRGGRRAGWFGKDLDRSRLDLFYWLLACIGAVNLAFYALVAAKYTYKQQAIVVKADADDDRVDR